MQQIDLGHQLNSISTWGAERSAEEQTAFVMKTIKSKKFKQTGFNSNEIGPEELEPNKSRKENIDTLNFSKLKLEVFMSETLRKTMDS
jgi:hypothetical protein